MRKIPEQIYQFYRNASSKTRVYVKLRWKLCPFEKIESLLPDKDLIIDAGCGCGMLANYLVFKSSKRQVIGLDNSLKRIAVAQTTVGQRKNIKFICDQIENLDSVECQAVVMSDFLHHLPEQVSQKLLSKVFKILNPGGKLILQEVDKRPYWKYLITLVIDRLLNPFQKLNYQPADYWKQMLEQVGFRVEVVPAHQGLPLADVIFVCSK